MVLGLERLPVSLDGRKGNWRGGLVCGPNCGPVHGLIGLDFSTWEKRSQQREVFCLSATFLFGLILVCVQRNGVIRAGGGIALHHEVIRPLGASVHGIEVSRLEGRCIWMAA